MADMISPKILGSAIAIFGGGAILASLAIVSGAAAWGPRTIPMLAGGVMMIAGIAVVLERPPATEVEASGREVNAVVGEDDAIPAEANRITFAPQGINVYADDWRIAPRGTSA